MARTVVKFVLNRKNVREQLLLSLGSPKVEELLVSAAKAAAPAGTDIEVSRTFGPSGRVRVRIIDRSTTAADRDANTGHLQSALNRIRL